MITQWETEWISLSVFPVARVMIAQWESPEPVWQKRGQSPLNGTTQPVGIKEEDQSSTTDKWWLKKYWMVSPNQWFVFRMVGGLVSLPLFNVTFQLRRGESTKWRWLTSMRQLMLRSLARKLTQEVEATFGVIIRVRLSSGILNRRALFTGRSERAGDSRHNFSVLINLRMTYNNKYNGNYNSNNNNMKNYNSNKYDSMNNK